MSSDLASPSPGWQLASACWPAPPKQPPRSPGCSYSSHYVSTALVPAHSIPAVLGDFARFQPFIPIIETMRGLWMGHMSTGAAVGHEALLAIAYCAGIIAVSAVAASWLFGHRTAA